ncbi:uncharacterized protein ARMOST_22142 [Armillaria ostoyae]|uniref:Uncharacterized protein n=1 Tax=Armillaria ostoyae TaxID=47428 RepID=A0A284SC25_ARMOS|nr:uncharacterized protein ARMOST_22142 [Armillaria ostoyae]
MRWTKRRREKPGPKEESDHRDVYWRPSSGCDMTNCSTRNNVWLRYANDTAGLQGISGFCSIPNARREAENDNEFRLCDGLTMGRCWCLGLVGLVGDRTAALCFELMIESEFAWLNEGLEFTPTLISTNGHWTICPPNPNRPGTLNSAPCLVGPPRLHCHLLSKADCFALAPIPSDLEEGYLAEVIEIESNDVQRAFPGSRDGNVRLDPKWCGPLNTRPFIKANTDKAGDRLGTSVISVRDMTALTLYHLLPQENTERRGSPYGNDLKDKTIIETDHNDGLYFCYCMYQGQAATS